MYIAALHFDPCPALLLRAWFWFWELSPKRQIAVGMAGVPQAIPYTEIEAWCRYTGNRPTYLERKALDAFDRAYLEVMK